MYRLILESLEQTCTFGKKLGQLCEPGDVICLHGDLGAGKTTLTQSIAHGVGVDQNEYVTSPSYSVFHHYQGKLDLYHMDLYRLQNSDEVISMGLDEYFHSNGVTVIEWFKIALGLIPPRHLVVELRYRSETSREVTWSSSADEWQQRLDLLYELFHDTN